MKVSTILKRKMKYYFLRANSFEKSNLNDEIIIIKKIERGISLTNVLERRERRFVEESEVWIEEIGELNFIRVDFPLDFLIEMKKNK